MTFESTLRSDLEALGADNRRDPLPLPEALSAGVYRDDRPGAEARRNALLDQRRHELAFMPLSYSHVFAHRVARAAAGGMAMLCSVAIMLVLADPVFATYFLHEIDPTSFSVMAGIAVLSSYVVATWIAERVFERRLRQALTLAGDVHADLDRLGEAPVDIARGLVRRVDAWAVGMALGGTIAVAVLFGVVTFVLGSHNLHHLRAWVVIAVAGDMKLLLAALGGGLVLASVVARACARREPSPWTTWTAHWASAAAGVVVGLGTLYVGMREVYLTQKLFRVPTLSTSIALALAGVVATFLVAAFAILWWRRREELRLV
ncbi:MAG TPA: hypothetical protein VLB44_05980 [Kofleriaceae bacterium]|nr:hypothetical protein [Kofleriaceae bacterium]